jgi:hypothetical protein
MGKPGRNWRPSEVKFEENVHLKSHKITYSRILENIFFKDGTRVLKKPGARERGVNSEQKQTGNGGGGSNRCPVIYS